MSPVGAWTAAAAIALGAQVAPSGCANAAPVPVTPDPAPKGIERNDLDRSADPCTDFHAFASGTWRAAHPIPKGMQRWSRRTAARETNRQQLQTLLEELAARTDWPPGSVEQQLGDHFAACMNVAAIDAAGVTPLAALLADIAAVEDRAGVQRIIRHLHGLAIPAPFVVTAISDYHDPEAVVLNIAGGGLGLPNRDYYVSPEPPFAEARQRYRAHVARMLTLAGTSTLPPPQAADEILALETRLAEASLPPTAPTDPAATAHKLTFAQLAQRAPRFEWERYFAEAGLPRRAVNVAEPAFVERLNHEFETTPVATWKAYLSWHLLALAAPWLSKPFADEAFEFRDRYLGGASAPAARATSCVALTEALLGEPLGRVYVARHFPPAAKTKVQALVRSLLAVLTDDISQLRWLSAAAKQQALAKLRAYHAMVGYPDAWRDHSALAIRRDAFWANVVAARRFAVETLRRDVGQRTSRTLWQLPPSSPDAYIDIQLNLMVLPAGFLQAPAFDPAASDAVNYGAIGIGIAHDLTHAIDSLGRDFDAQGRPRSWWTPADLEAFRKIGQCTVDQYDGYAIQSGAHHQGQRVLAEALGDLAGARLAYRALQRSMQLQPVPTLDGFSPEQQFFIAWGQFRGATESPELERQMVVADPHPTARYRVIGPLSNMPEFQQAFACPAGSAMVKPPERRCTVW